MYMYKEMSIIYPYGIGVMHHKSTYRSNVVFLWGLISLK